MKMNRLDQELGDLDDMLDMAENLVLSQTDCINKTQKEFEDFFQTYGKVMQLQKLMQDQVKAEIEDLQKEYDSYVAGSDKALELKETLRQEGQLRQEYCSIQEKKEELSTECQALQKRVSQLKMEDEKLQEEKERRENETAVVLPLKREELRLLMSISGIVWNFEGSSDKVDGHITNRSDVKNFSFDKTASSQFTITNSLWDFMCED